LKEPGEILLITDNAQYYRWSVQKYAGSQHENYHKDHHMIFYPENVFRLMKLAGLKVRKWSYVKQQSNKLDLLAKLLIGIGFWRKECIFNRFTVEAVKIDS
jgi:hypothetical protein